MTPQYENNMGDFQVSLLFAAIRINATLKDTSSRNNRPIKADLKIVRTNRRAPSAERRHNSEPPPRLWH